MSADGSQRGKHHGMITAMTIPPLAKPPVRHLIIALLLVSLGGVIGYQMGRGKTLPLVSSVAPAMLINAEQPAERKNVDFSQFWEVWSILEQTYLEPEKIDTQQQVYGAIQGMASSLEDPYTFYLPPSDQKRSAEDLAGAFFGVGIELGYTNGILSVTAPLKGSPAERQGIKAGDLILNISDTSKNLDKDTNGITLDEAVNLIRGERGVPVVLTIGREGQTEPLTISIARDEIVVPSVELAFVEHANKKVAHIMLSRFGDRTDQEWDSIVTQIINEPNLSGVLVDVRNNPGGYLDGAIDIASEFISDGVVVSQQGRDRTQKYTVTRQGRLTKLPVGVMINKGSASASEIVAGALRDRRQAPLIGENSYGKGTVQDALELDGGAGLHVTVARWLLPNGDWIHEKGIAPSVEAEDNADTQEDEVLLKAVESL